MNEDIQRIVAAIEAARAKCEQEAREATNDGSYRWAEGTERGLRRALEIIRQTAK